MKKINTTTDIEQEQLLNEIYTYLRIDRAHADLLTTFPIDAIVAPYGSIHHRYAMDIKKLPQKILDKLKLFRLKERTEIHTKKVEDYSRYGGLRW